MTIETIPPQLNGYFERSPVALSLALAGGQHALAFVNSAFERLTGYALSEIIGRNCRFLQKDADNAEARAKLRAFLSAAEPAQVRVMILNFRKDGQPFVNLLTMTKLRRQNGATPYILASQFDISRSQPKMLAAYDSALGDTFSRLSPALAEHGMIIESSLITIGNTAAAIAQAKLTLAEAGAGDAA
ncbi:PAS domain-containing protein [Acidisoma sp. C75]